MIVFSIDDTKAFMSKLLKENTFDFFEVRGIEVHSFTKFTITGTLDINVEEDKNSRDYCTWQQLRPYIFNIIKGSVKPRSIKIIFSLDTESSLKLHNNAAALYLNLHFVDDNVTFTTGTAQKSFILDKSLDQAWEDYIKKFFNSEGLLALNRDEC